MDAPLITAVFDLIDQLSRVSLRPETKNKLRAARAEVAKELKKEEEERKAEVWRPLILCDDWLNICAGIWRRR